MARDLLPPLLVALLLWGSGLAAAKTRQQDVSALNVMYTSLNSPSQLTGWRSSGGDPCGDGWKGIDCSGSSVTEISLSGLGLSGSLGYQLASLTSVTDFDLSKNNLNGDIPYQLPPNLKHLNLAGNAFTGVVPYSISQMTNIKSLNLANNQLKGQLNDIFGKLSDLSELDLSFNHFTGNLPQSFGSLSNLRTLNLENNQFSGTIKVLADLHLNDLNVQNNQLTGYIPNTLKNIQTLQIGGNPWSSGRPPHGMDTAANTPSHGDNGTSKSKAIALGLIFAGIVMALLVVSLIILVLVKRRPSFLSHYADEELSQNRSTAPLVSGDLSVSDSNHVWGVPTGTKDYSSAIDIKVLQTPPSTDIKPPPPPKSFNDDEFVTKVSIKSSSESNGVTAFSLGDLQAATRSFNTSRLMGRGTIGCVYKAKYDDGKVLAVKKIDSLDFSGGSSHNFMEVVSGVRKLHHPNIAELLGYCSESSYHLLVYEFQSNGSLHDFLHLSDEYSKPLTWDTRVRIALGTARAVEYLHEVCSPSAIHKNIKSSNILLDTELNPHLSDCGLAAFFEDTSDNLGAGYNAPECVKPSAYTVKSDVYSFGVVMLELMTGRKPFDSSKPRMEQSLVRWATPQLHDIDALAHMVDPALRGLYPPRSLSRFADVIALCIQSEPEFRPPMSEVVQSLARCVQQRMGANNRLGGALSTSCRSDESDYY